MLKVFLVEDEVVVREGIKKKIDWEAHGFSFVGEAPDGELAYTQILETRPDVVITDIKMPFMDGLQLSRLLHQELPGIKIIILTGHDDFKYAQEAIGIGVTDYLLKPVSRNQIIETILKVKRQIELEREQQSFVERYRQEMREKELLSHQRFFDKLVGGETPTPQLLVSAKELGLELGAASYAVLLVRFFSPVREDYSEAQVRLQEALERLLAAEGGLLCFNRGVEGYALLAKGGAGRPALEIARATAEQLAALFAAEGGVQYYLGIGTGVERIQEIEQSYGAASRAFAHQYVLGDSGVVEYGSMRPVSATGESISLEDLDIAALDRAVVERFLKSGTREDAEYLVNDLFQSIGEEHLKSLMLRQYITMAVYFAALQFVEGLGASKQQFIAACGDIGRVGEELASLGGTRAYLLRVLKEALALRDESSQKRHGAVLQEAEAYIQAHFCEEDISLNSVAKAVNMSPTHFSAIFSQEMGCTFVEYLTAARMQKARELLRCTGMKSSEIAYAVGYRDPHYFSFLFKKLQGTTPREFRAEGREDK